MIGTAGLVIFVVAFIIQIRMYLRIARLLRKKKYLEVVRLRGYDTRVIPGFNTIQCASFYQLDTEGYGSCVFRAGWSCNPPRQSAPVNPSSKYRRKSFVAELCGYRLYMEDFQNLNNSRFVILKVHLPDKKTAGSLTCGI